MCRAQRPLPKLRNRNKSFTFIFTAQLYPWPLSVVTERYPFWHVRICCCRPACSPELPVWSSINQHFGSSAEDASAERAARGTYSWAPWGYPMADVGWGYAMADVGWGFPGSRSPHQAATASPKLLVLGEGCRMRSSCSSSWTQGAMVHWPLPANVINHLLMWCVCLN